MLCSELLPCCCRRPYVAVEKYTVEGDYSEETIPEEKITCDLHGLMSSRNIIHIEDLWSAAGVCCVLIHHVMHWNTKLIYSAL